MFTHKRFEFSETFRPFCIKWERIPDGRCGFRERPITIVCKAILRDEKVVRVNFVPGTGWLG